MGKKSKSQSKSWSATESQSAAAPSTSFPFLVGKASVDTTVASLFEKSVSAIAIIFKLGIVADMPLNH